MNLRTDQIITCIAAAGAIHAGLFYAFLRQGPEGGAAGSGTGGISISLGPTGGAPEVERAEAASFLEAEAVPLPAPAPFLAPQVVAPPTTPVETVQVPETVKPDRPSEIEPIVPETVVAEPLLASKTAPPEPVQIAQAQTSQAPRRLDQAQKQPSAASGARPQTVQAETPAGLGGSGGTQASVAQAAAAAASGGGNPGAKADYLAFLRAWFAHHKEYPRRARQRRQEGVAMLYLVIDRNGRVLDWAIQSSSGHRLLDKAVEQMVMKAQPLPAMPASLHLTQLELMMPVRFELR